MNCIEALLILTNSNYIQISEELKKQTGWILTNQSSEDLYEWMITKYGNQWNLCGEEGEVLRTMKPNSYLKFLDYCDRKIN